MSDKRLEELLFSAAMTAIITYCDARDIDHDDLLEMASNIASATSKAHMIIAGQDEVAK